MASPAVESINPTADSQTGGAATGGDTAANSHSVVLPATVSAGALLIVCGRIATDTASVTLPAGWTVIQDSSDAANDITFWAYKNTLAVGNEDGTSITVGHGTSCKMVATSLSITGAANPATQAPQASTVAIGTNNTHDPTSVAPTGGSKDYLFLWFGAWDGEQTVSKTTATNYTDRADVTSGTGGLPATNVQMKVGDRALTASSEDPGTVTSVGTLTGWTAWTIAVHPFAAATLERSAAIAGTGGVASVPQRALLRSTAIAGTGAVVSAATFFSVEARSAALSASTGIASSGLEVLPRSATLSAASAIATAARRDLPRSAALASTAAIAVSGEVVPSGPAVYARSAALGASTGLASAATFWTIFERQAALAATGAVASVPRRELQRSVAIAAQAAVASNGEILGAVQRSASLAATGLIASQARRDLSRSAALAALASITSDSERELLRVAHIASVGTLATSGGISTSVERAVALAAGAAISSAGGIGAKRWPVDDEDRWAGDGEVEWPASTDDQWLVTSEERW